MPQNRHYIRSDRKWTNSVAFLLALLAQCSIAENVLAEAAAQPKENTEGLATKQQDDPNLPAFVRCDFQKLEDPRHTGAVFQELGNGYKVNSQQDRRAWEVAAGLQKGIDCLSKEVHTLTETVHGRKQVDRQHQQKLEEILDKTAMTLQVLNENLKRHRSPGGTSLTPADQSALQQLSIEARKANDQLAEIAKAIGNMPSVPGSPNGPPAIIVNTYPSVTTSVLPTPHADSQPRQQLDPNASLITQFQGQATRIEFAVVAIPDPRVPRHRRQYDNAITAINQGMLSQRYVLDSFGFPWSKDLQEAAAAPPAGQTSNTRPNGSSDQGPRYVSDDKGFGLMVFRHDCWRDSEPPEQPAPKQESEPQKGSVTEKEPEPKCVVSLRAVYVVPESATYGIQTAALREALHKIDSQLPAVQTAPASDPPKNEIQVTKGKTDSAIGKAGTQTPGKTAPDTSPVSADERRGCLPENKNCEVILYGPTFSGSLDSIRELMWEISRQDPKATSFTHIRSMRILGTSTTVYTNHLIVAPTQAKDAPTWIRYVQIASTDSEKFQELFGLLPFWNIRPDKVAIVYEATTFGLGACPQGPQPTEEPPNLCTDALKLPFPVNIADVRFGLRAKMASHTKDSSSKIPLMLDASHLSLEDGAENGSEYPESQQSPLTAASTALEIDKLVEALRDRDAQLVVIVATDVRDRLFLIERFGSALSGALFVDLGADRLLSHPDFIHATRGALTLSSSPLFNAQLSARCKEMHEPSCDSVQDGVRPGNATTQVWSTDEQASLARALRFWQPGEFVVSQAATAGESAQTSLPTSGALGRSTEAVLKLPRPPIPYVVSRVGLVSARDLSDHPILRKAEVCSPIALAVIFALLGVYWTLTAQIKAVLAQIEAREQGSAPLLTWDWGLAFSLVWRLAVGCLSAWLMWVVTHSGVLAATVAIGGLYFLGFPMGTALHWSRVVIWLSAACLGLMAVVGVSGSRPILFNADASGGLRDLLVALSQAPKGGMAYPLAFLVAVIAITITMRIASRIATRTNEVNQVVTLGWSEVARDALLKSNRRGGWFVTVLGIATIVAAIFIYEEMRQVTVFGRWADLSAFASLVSTTLFAICMLAGAVCAGGRINTLCDFVAQFMRENHGYDPPPELEDPKDPPNEPLCWTGVTGGRPDFIPTPVLASLGSGGPLIVNLRDNIPQWKNAISELTQQVPLSQLGRRGLYALLSSEIGGYQWCIAGAALMSIASGLITYLFPVSQATSLMVVNLVTLLLSGTYAAYKTVSFEGNLILSNVLCNRFHTRKWSMTLFSGVAIPFVALAVVIGLGQVPGVLDVGDGLLSVLLKWAKPGGE